MIGRIEPEDTARVTDARRALRHRGPDGEGQWSWVDPATGFGAVLGHTRLSVLDLRSSAGQPMVDEDTGVCLVYNGEIYNFGEIRRELEARGQIFATSGDTEVLLRGYLCWGDEVAARLRGMFSFVIFDPRFPRAVFARDGHGIKPLYVASIGNGRAVAFASEVRALLSAGYAPRETDARRVHRYLWNGFMPSPQTLVRGIDCFPRGSVGRIDGPGEQLSTQAFWTLRAENADVCSLDEGRSAIRETVQAHLVSDVLTGVFLSGGVDSSVIAGVVSEGSTCSQLRTLSLGFEGDDLDETAYAEVIARAIGSDHRSVMITGDEVLRDLDDAIGSFDQPTFDGINTWIISRAGVEQGLKVALTGTGGDELLGGYSSFSRLPRLLPWARRARPMSGPGSRLPLSMLGGGYRSRAKLGDLGKAGGCPVALYQLQYGLFPSRTVASLVGGDSDGFDPWGLEPGRLEELRGLVSEVSPIRAVGYLETELYLGDRLLRDTDSASMAHGLEVRVPLVDTHLTGRLAGLCDDARYRPVGTKPALRQIAEERFGKMSFDRPKGGFELPFDRWLRGTLRDEVEQVLHDATGCERAGVCPHAARALWRAYIEHPGMMYWSRVWTVYVLVRWCAMHGIRRVD